MPRILLGASFVLSVVSACASQPAVPAKPQLDTETQLAPRRQEKPHEPPPRIVAPPPAYGNKIVMAGAPNKPF